MALEEGAALEEELELLEQLLTTSAISVTPISAAKGREKPRLRVVIRPPRSGART